MNTRVWVKNMVWLAGCIGFAGGISVSAEEVKLGLMPEGATRKLGGYMPQKLTLSSKAPEGLKKTPAGLEAPVYGELKLGASEASMTFYLILDEPDGKPARLFVDSNGSGEIGEDSACEWKARTSENEGRKLTMYSGGATFKPRDTAGAPMPLHVEMYRFDKTDPQRAALKDTLLYYSDYARSGEMTLSGKPYKVLLTDDSVTGDFRPGKDSRRLLVDVNDDGKFNRNRETFDLKKPFNVGGTTYEIRDVKADGSSLELVKSDKAVEETKPPLNLEAGQRALPFQAKTTSGEAIKFPETYKGKLVLLDFWATWCGPCRAELPNLTEVYKKFHKDGFEVLGVSLDQPNSGSKLESFTKDNDMPWPQIYDGKYWQAEVAKKYEIESIPRAFLVDGDTGMIVAEGGDLRGENLEKTVENQLSKRRTAGINREAPAVARGF